MEETFDSRKHWEHIYKTRQPHEVSWYQSTPGISLDLIREMDLPLSARIIDVGGGDSLLVDHLLKMGFRNISVLDISEAAIEKSKLRLGEKAQQVKWIVSDVTRFDPHEKYDLWHDRAAFHFLTREQEISSYVRILQNSLSPKGAVIIGTFSDQGPQKCSGIDIKQYTEDELGDLFQGSYERISCQRIDHTTPFGTSQNFVFCSFRRALTF